MPRSVCSGRLCRHCGAAYCDRTACLRTHRLRHDCRDCGICGYACWVLLRRRPLLQVHRVVAGYLACGFSGLFAVVALVTAIATGASAAWLAGSQGGLMFIIAVMLLVHARHKRDELRARRDVFGTDAGGLMVEQAEFGENAGFTVLRPARFGGYCHQARMTSRAKMV